jgi:hypothetical protein
LRSGKNSSICSVSNTLVYKGMLLERLET